MAWFHPLFGKQVTESLCLTMKEIWHSHLICFLTRHSQVLTRRWTSLWQWLNPWYDRMYRVLYLGLEWQVRMQPRLKQSEKSLQKLTRPSFLLVSKVANKEKRERRLGREGNRPSLPSPSPPLLTSATQANRRYCPGQSDFPWTMNKLIRSRTKYIFVADDKPGKTQASNMISIKWDKGGLSSLNSLVVSTFRTLCLLYWLSNKMCIPRTMPLNPSHSVDSIVQSMFIRILSYDFFWQICSCTFQAKTISR